MRAVGELIAEVREALRGMVEPGVSTLELNAAAEKMMRDAGAIPTFIGYKPHGMVPFPFAICASVNDADRSRFFERQAVERGRYCFARYGVHSERICRRYGDHRSGRRDQRTS